MSDITTILVMCDGFKGMVVDILHVLKCICWHTFCFLFWCGTSQILGWVQLKGGSIWYAFLGLYIYIYIYIYIFKCLSLKSLE